jgi:putative heme-binding domain-containing protein
MLLENLIAPDLEVAPQYFLWEGQLKNGESVLGVIVEESGTELTFRAADGTSTTVARGDLKRLTNLNRSLMPAGLEGGLSVQEMADLLSYLTGGK